MNRSRFLQGQRIAPDADHRETSIVELIESNFQAYNAARLREAAQLFAEQDARGRRHRRPDADRRADARGPRHLGAHPADRGRLRRLDHLDRRQSLSRHALRPRPRRCTAATRRRATSCCARKASSASTTSSSTTRCCSRPTPSSARSSTRRSSSARCRRRSSTTSAASTSPSASALLGLEGQSLLAAAYEHGVPVYTSSPGDSSIGMNVAAMELQGSKLRLNPSARRQRDGGDRARRQARAGASRPSSSSAAAARRTSCSRPSRRFRKCSASRRRATTTSCSSPTRVPTPAGSRGATPGEAVSWGKIDPDQLPDAVVCYVDSTVALPLITAYAFARREPRPLKRLYDRRDELMGRLRDEYERSTRR